MKKTVVLHEADAACIAPSSIIAVADGDALMELNILKEAIGNAGKVAHLYNTGSGLLGWLESEIKCIREDKEKAPI